MTERLTLTYGILPNFAEVSARMAALDADPYAVNLKGEDLATFNRLPDEDFRLGEPTGEWSACELYQALSELVEAWGQGDDGAGNLASAILEALNVEWV